MENEMVRIKYWSQETEEFGVWKETTPMKRKDAVMLIEEHWYDRAEIVDRDS